MIINHNMMAMNAHRSLTINAGDTSKSIEKLSSGLRINRAGDDAAGLAISEKMRAQIRGLQQASRNAQDGISMIQTAEGALNETHSILQRMRELAVQSANDTNTNTEDRNALNKEFGQLQDELDRIANDSKFNTKALFGDAASTPAVSATFHVGADAGQVIKMDFASIKSNATNLSVAKGTVKVDTQNDANTAITSVNDAINKVSGYRADLGSVQNRLEHTIKNLDVAAENLQASESRVRDVDMAKEMMNFTKSNILNQAAQAMLAQANQVPQGVLQLLR